MQSSLHKEVVGSHVNQINPSFLGIFQILPGNKCLLTSCASQALEICYLSDMMSYEQGFYMTVNHAVKVIVVVIFRCALLKQGPIFNTSDP